MANDNLDQISIDTLPLSMQALGSLKRSQIQTIADLMNYTQEDLKLLDPATGEAVIQALEQHLGLTLPLNDLQYVKVKNE
jgi:DNA-directed RNA polymerase subunit alpha